MPIWSAVRWSKQMLSRNQALSRSEQWSKQLSPVYVHNIYVTSALWNCRCRCRAKLCRFYWVRAGTTTASVAVALSSWFQRLRAPRSERRLCFYLSVRHFVSCVCLFVCLFHDNGLKPSPIVMKFVFNVLGSNTERRTRMFDFFYFTPVSNGGHFSAIFRCYGQSPCPILMKSIPFNVIIWDGFWSADKC